MFNLRKSCLLHINEFCFDEMLSRDSFCISNSDAEIHPTTRLYSTSSSVWWKNRPPHVANEITSNIFQSQNRYFEVAEALLMLTTEAQQKFHSYIRFTTTEKWITFLAIFHNEKSSYWMYKNYFHCKIIASGFFNCNSFYLETERW